jgi:raffinose/stachyose/melibiose transport system permease protein
MAREGMNVSRTRGFLAFVLPALLLVCLAFYIPFLMNAYFAFTDWNGIQRAAKFNGLANFSELLGDSDFLNSVLFTLKYAVAYIVLSNAGAIVIAVILNRKLRVANAIRAALFVPYILSLVIVGFIWNFILGAGFQSLGDLTRWAVFRIDWLGDLRFVSLTVISVSVWQSLGFYVLIYHAGLQAIPQDLYEAVLIDGAGPIKKFFRITLPMLGPSITSGVFFSLAASIRVYDVIVSLTRGGPGRATTSVTLDIYTEAFTHNRYGYGTAKSLVLLLAVMAFAAVQLRFMKAREVEA